jgi:hypothetical protein
VYLVGSIGWFCGAQKQGCPENQHSTFWAAPSLA